MSEKKRKPTTAVFKLRARTYAPWDMIGNPLADFADADINLYEVRVPRAWETGIPRGNLTSIREWMDRNDLVLVDVQHHPASNLGSWRGVYVCKIGKKGEWKLNPYEVALGRQPEPENSLPI